MIGAVAQVISSPVLVGRAAELGEVVLGRARAELELPLEHRGDSRAAVARAVEETALSLGVAQLLDRRTDTLSGGELQRVAIAAASRAILRLRIACFQTPWRPRHSYVICAVPVP